MELPEDDPVAFAEVVIGYTVKGLNAESRVIIR